MRAVRAVPPALVVVLAVLACLVVPRAVMAFPGSSPSLWDLTRQAEVIVLADVRGIEPIRELEDPTLNGILSLSGDTDTLHVAHLGVREVWKGEAGARIDVCFDPDYGDPGSPLFLPGGLVIAFLLEYGESWFPVGIAYGTLYPAAGETDAFGDRVREAVALQEGGKVARPDWIAWHVRAAARPATRWHGLSGLIASRDPHHYYYGGAAGTGEKEARLAADEYDAIARGFIEGPLADAALPMILELFAGRPHHGLDRAAIAALEGALLQDPLPAWIGNALERLLTRLGDTDARKRLEPLGEDPDDIPARLAREIWLDAKRDLYLPELPAAAAPRDEFRVAAAEEPW